MSARIRHLAPALRAGLAAIYGPRLRGIYFFGSHARGTAGAESDLDVLVVLDQVDEYGAEIDRTSELVGSLALEHGVSISRMFASENAWRAGASAFLKNVRDEAIPA